MVGTHGTFVWYELMTPDAAAALAFYAAAIGWSVRDSGMPGIEYSILSAGEHMVGGLMPLSPAAREAGARPGWVGYIGVADTDAAAERLQAAGGSVHRPPADIPGVGRFAVVADPQGPSFVLFTPAAQDAPPAAAAAGAPGHVGWHELHTPDREAALAFYAAMFGWTATDAIDLGQMGIYQMFSTGGPASGGVACGGMMGRSGTDPVRGWLYYFNVAEIDAAIGRVQAAGGQVVHGPAQVPGGSWIAHCTDPQGAMFAMVATPARA